MDDGICFAWHGFLIKISDDLYYGTENVFWEVTDHEIRVWGYQKASHLKSSGPGRIQLDCMDLPSWESFRCYQATLQMGSIPDMELMWKDGQKWLSLVHQGGHVNVGRHLVSCPSLWSVWLSNHRLRGDGSHSPRVAVSMWPKTGKTALLRSPDHPSVSSRTYKV